MLHARELANRMGISRMERKTWLFGLEFSISTEEFVPWLTFHAMFQMGSTKWNLRKADPARDSLRRFLTSSPSIASL
jgi:hypothetical protein